MADQYAVMRWLDDGNRLSVHSSKQIVEPKLTDLHIGCCGVAKYHGYPGLWKFRILKLGGKKELKLWLDNHIANLTADVTDVSFTETDVSVCSNENVSDSNNNNVLDSNNNNNNNVSDSNNNSNVSDSNNNVSDSNNNNNVSDSNNNNNTPRNGHTCEGTPSTKRIDSPRITTTVDGTDSFQYIKETAKTDLYKEKIEQLEEDVRSIRRKYRRLEEKVNQLEKSTRHPASETPASDQRTPAKIPASENKTPASDHNPQTPASGDKTAEPVDPNQLLADDQHISPQALETTLTSSIKGIIGEQNIVKHLIFQVFTKEEIVSCTRTGKRTFKNMDNTRPSLDPIKFNILERVVLKVTSMQKASFHKKFENQQKVLRRGEKE